MGWGGEAEQLERLQRKHLSEMEDKKRLFPKMCSCQLALPMGFAEDMLRPMVKMERFIHPFFDDVQKMQNAALPSEHSLRNKQITQGRYPGRKLVLPTL